MNLHLEIIGMYKIALEKNTIALDALDNIEIGVDVCIDQSRKVLLDRCILLRQKITDLKKEVA